MNISTAVTPAEEPTSIAFREVKAGNVLYAIKKKAAPTNTPIENKA